MKRKTPTQKKTLKSKLLLIIALVCVVQFAFAAGGYIFVYGNLRESSEDRISLAFDETLQTINGLKTYSDSIMNVVSDQVTLRSLSRDNLNTNMLQTYELLTKTYNFLRMAAADGRISEAMIYVPGENIFVSSRRGAIVNDEEVISRQFFLFDAYRDNPDRVFFPYIDTDTKNPTGSEEYYYVCSFPSSYGHTDGIFLMLKMSDNFFETVLGNSTLDDSESVVLIQDGALLLSTDADSVTFPQTVVEKVVQSGQSETLIINGVDYYSEYDTDSSGKILAVFLSPKQVFYSDMYIFIALVATSIILNIVVWFVFARSVIFKAVYSPVMDLVSSLEKMENNDFDLIQKDFDEREWDEVTRVFNMLIRRVKNNVRETYEKDLLVKSMELKFLQSQINPHFLYNTLDSIAYKANAGEIVDVNRITGYLSKMYRLIFNKGNDFIRTGDVLTCCEMFLKICEFKYSNFAFRIRIADGISNIETLNLVIQTIVENAVVHGYSADRKQFIVFIGARAEGDKLIFDVIDNGKGIDSDRLDVFKMLLSSDNIQSNSGMANVQKRIHLYYGKGYGIKIRSRRGCYTKVTVEMSVNKPAPVVKELRDYEDEEDEDV